METRTASHLDEERERMEWKKKGREGKKVEEKDSTVPLTSKWTNTRGRLAGNPGVILSCPRNRVSLTAGTVDANTECITRWCGYVRALHCVYARESHTTTT